MATAKTVSLEFRVTTPSGSTVKTVSKTGSAVYSVEEDVADSSTDLLIAFTLDVSACKAFFINSTKNVTVETNNGTTPADTLSLVANEPYVWHATSLDTFKLGTDVTALYITNSSGATATITIEALTDATP